MFSLYLEVFSITFAMLCVVGPICLTVINTTILHGFKAGLFAALGVIVADYIYILMSVFFLELVSDFIKNNNYLLLIAIMSGIFLIYLAYKFWNLDVGKFVNNVNIKAQSNFNRFISLFVLTITGPTSVLTYAAVFSNFIGKKLNVYYVLAGAMSGTFCFYFILVTLLSIVRKQMTIKLISVINKFASALIVFFASVIIYKSLKMMLHF